MRTICLFILLVTLAACSKSNPENNDSSAPPISLFDGHTWDQWEGDKSYFRIESEAIVAGSLAQPIPKNQFLCTEASYDNFELRLKVKFTSKDNNAGIQFRTKRIPNHHEVIGYQADVGYLPDRPIWASLYDESRRNRFLVEPPADAVWAALDTLGWNDYRIYCNGDSIKFWLNDHLLLQYEEKIDSIARSGVVCLQIHSGPPAEAWYKDIFIAPL